MNLGKYSFGIGDRFGHQGRAQLAALVEAKRQGVDIVPVWNKSNREHCIVGTKPADVRSEADVTIKTAGTTWLEELVGLALAEGEGLAIAKEIYGKSLARIDELCGPYATVIDIDRTKLPTADEVRQWSGEQFAAALRHDQTCPAYNPNLRQLLHVGYKVAAELGPRFLAALDRYEPTIAENVTANLYDSHIRPLFLQG